MQTPSPTAMPVATIALKIFPSDKLNDWEPEYSTTGTQLDLLELRRTQETGKSTAITYQLATTGLDKGQSYELWSFSISIGKPQLAGKVDLDADGNVGVGALTIASFSKGEPLRLALMSADRKTVVFGKVIPFPIEAIGANGGCSLSVELASPQGNAFWISGAGFTPNEELVYISRSGQGEISDRFEVDARGKFSVLVLPAVVGQEFGTASYTARGSVCQASVDYEWGSAAIRSQ